VKTAIAVIVAWLIAGPVLAQEPVGCDKFKWPLDKERAMLTAADVPAVASGASVAKALPVTVSVNLVPFSDAKLPTPPERAPKSRDSFAGFIKVAAPPQAGTYKITLSAAAWVDVVQGGHLIKSDTFSGALGCEGIRKSVKFDLTAAPFTVQLSSVQANLIRLAITGD
jgi:hypothetical protein